MTEYSASDRVKLSFHTDGFVQFSSERKGRILSGRDPDTGEPRGLGIMLEHPLSETIRSGPTFGSTLWGLADFEPVTSSDRNLLVFEEDDFYYRGTSPVQWNAYVLEFFILPSRYWSAVRGHRNRYTLSIAAGTFEAGGAVLEWRVIELPGQDLLLGLMCSRTIHGFPSESGFTLGSPSDRREGGQFANVLMAVYPLFLEEPPRESLDYVPTERERTDQ
jgi:hypothetical protein